MDAAMIGQIDKAIQYAQEPDRIKLVSLRANFVGEEKDHLVTYLEGKWHCTSHMFETRGVSAYIMAMERILAEWVEPAEVEPGSYDTTMIAQIEKSIERAEDTDRIQILAFKVLFSGKHKEHVLTYNEGIWHCNCHVFHTRGVCAHVMTIERLLAGQVEYAKAVPVPA